MNSTEALHQVGTLFGDELNSLICLFLLAVGRVLKRARHMPDWSIVVLVPLLGAAVASAVLSHAWAVAVMIGVCDGVAAVYAHQVAKQFFLSPPGQSLLVKSATAQILAVLVGVTPKPQGQL